jgi:hypothetical protein
MSKQEHPLMGPKLFWDLLAHACEPGEEEVWHDRLVEELAHLPPEDILAFARRFDSFLDAAYTFDLWGAAWLINSGCSDDGFSDFRNWLVGMGHQVYEAALANPDSLADVVSPDEVYAAGISGAPGTAWEQVTGGDDEAFLDALYGKGGPVTSLRGEDWDFDDEAEVLRRLPHLAEIYVPAEEYPEPED